MKKQLKYLTCFLLAGMMIVACKDPNPSNSSGISQSSEPSSPSISETSSPSTDVSPSDSSAPSVETEIAEFALNVSTDLEAKKLDADITHSIFTINAGTEVRNRTKVWTNPEDSTDTKEFIKSVKLGNDASTISVAIPGTGTMSVYVQNGSSGAAMQNMMVTDPSGKATAIEFAGTDYYSPVVKIDIPVTEGTYKLNRDTGTIDIFLIEVSVEVEKSEEVGFEIVNEGKVDFLQGEAFESAGLKLNRVYGNGRVENLPLSDVTINSTAYNPANPGMYTISISYGAYEALTYDVCVYEIKSMDLGFDAIEQIGNSNAGNGVYFNHSVKEVYGVNEAFDDTGLNAIVKAEYLDKSLTITAKDNVTYSQVDTSTKGRKDVTVTYNGVVSETFPIYVVDTAPAYTEANGYQVKVDQSYTGEIGAVVDNYNMFTTVQQALDYLAMCEEIENADKKLIVLEEGTYTEKLEITIPYLTIKGNDAEKTMIEWDSLFGIEDAGGFVHTTDSTATVAIRDSAVGVVFDGITISNYWNSQERFDTDLGPDYGEHRALALLVQTDQFIMKNSRLLGYQDTLELFTGRQYFENTFIQGVTDFIFGTNNTTYFKDCTIHSITRNKNDGGYITAFKGSNKGSGDYVQYGAIFDGCNFTADEVEYAKGNTAIGRCWAAYAAVMVMNSELGAHISTKPFSGSSKNERYVSMNAKPTDETVKFTEYNNTGAGAITESVAGCTMLTAEEAAKYADFEVIFGTKNGAVSYVNPWDPTATEVPVDNNIYYYFNGSSSATGTSYTYDQNINGTTGTFGDIAVDGTAGKVTARDSDTQINKGGKLTFTVAANSSVLVTTYPEYHDYVLNGVATSADTFEQFYAQETTVVFEAKSTVYLFSIIIKPNQTAPEAATINKLKLSGQTTSFVVGQAFDYSSLVVNAEYSDFSVRPIDVASCNVAFDGDINVAGDYTVTVSYEGASASYTVTYANVNVDPTVIAKDTQITFGSNGNYKESKLITEGASLRDNAADNCQISGNISIKVKAGATVTVAGYPNYTNYSVEVGGADISGTITGTDYSFTVEADSTVVFVCGNNNYFYSINVEYKTITESSQITFGTEGNYKDSLLVIEGANVRDNGGNNSQIKGAIELQVLPNATITINGYSGYTNYTVALNDGEVSAAITDTTYTFTTSEVTKVVLNGLDNNYFYDISISYPNYLDESTSITFGSGGNYKDSTLVTEGANVRDNGGNNSQITGNISLDVKAGATINVSGYNGYTNYNVLINGVAVAEGITETAYSFVVDKDATITFVGLNNNYFYGIDVVFPISSNTNVSFGSEGNYAASPISLESANVRDNGGNNSQISGTVSFDVAAGATITINGYSGYTSYTVTLNGAAASETITDTTYTFTTSEKTTVVLECGGQNYFYSIDIAF